LRISSSASCEAILNRDQMESLGVCRMRLTSAPISRRNVEESNWYRWTKLGCTFDLRRERRSVRELAYVLISTILLRLRWFVGHLSFLLIVCQELLQTRFPQNNAYISTLISIMLHIFLLLYFFAKFRVKAANME